MTIMSQAGALRLLAAVLVMCSICVNTAEAATMPDTTKLVPVLLPMEDKSGSIFNEIPGIIADRDNLYGIIADRDNLYFFASKEDAETACQAKYGFGLCTKQQLTDAKHHSCRAGYTHEGERGAYYDKGKGCTEEQKLNSSLFINYHVSNGLVNHGYDANDGYWNLPDNIIGEDGQLPSGWYSFKHDDRNGMKYQRDVAFLNGLSSAWCCPMTAEAITIPINFDDYLVDKSNPQRTDFKEQEDELLTLCKSNDFGFLINHQFVDKLRRSEAFYGIRDKLGFGFTKMTDLGFNIDCLWQWNQSHGKLARNLNIIVHVRKPDTDHVLIDFEKELYRANQMIISQEGDEKSIVEMPKLIHGVTPLGKTVLPHLLRFSKNELIRLHADFCPVGHFSNSGLYVVQPRAGDLNRRIAEGQKMADQGTPDWLLEIKHKTQCQKCPTGKTTSISWLWTPSLTDTLGHTTMFRRKNTEEDCSSHFEICKANNMYYDSSSKSDGCDRASDAEVRAELSKLTNNDIKAINYRQGYRGCQTKTKSGKTCANWTHSGNLPSGRPIYDTITTLAAKSNEFGLGDHNYCRAVLTYDDGKPHPNFGKRCSGPTCNDSSKSNEYGIWCYTTDAGERWEECDPLDSSTQISLSAIDNSGSATNANNAKNDSTATDECQKCPAGKFVNHWGTGCNTEESHEYCEHRGCTLSINFINYPNFSELHTCMKRGDETCGEWVKFNGSGDSCAKKFTTGYTRHMTEFFEGYCKSYTGGWTADGHFMRSNRNYDHDSELSQFCKDEPSHQLVDPVTGVSSVYDTTRESLLQTVFCKPMAGPAPAPYSTSVYKFWYMYATDPTLAGVNSSFNYKSGANRSAIISLNPKYDSNKAEREFQQALKLENEIIEEAKLQAKWLSLQIGHKDFAFAGNYVTKGLYAYSEGTYKGCAFFGRGGNSEQQQASPAHPKYRPGPVVGLSLEQGTSLMIKTEGEKTNASLNEAEDLKKAADDAMYALSLSHVVIVVVILVFIVVAGILAYSLVRERRSNKSSEANINEKKPSDSCADKRVLGAKNGERIGEQVQSMKLDIEIGDASTGTPDAEELRAAPDGNMYTEM